MPNNNDYKYLLAKMAILTLALIIRLIHLDSSFWLDEAAQIIESSRPLSQQLDIIPDFQPPLFHLLVHFWQYLGHSEWFLRLASLIPGLVTIYFTILLGEKLKDRHTGLIAGMLLTTSQFHLFYSQELRPYSLSAMLAVISMYVFFQIKNSHKPSAMNHVLLAIINALGIYTTYLYPLIILTQFVLIIKKPTKGMLISLIASCIFFIPWLPTFFKQLNTGVALANTNPIWQEIVSPPLYKMMPLTLIKFILGRISLSYTFKDVALLIVAFITTASLLIKQLKNKKALPVFIWFILPLIIAQVISIKVPVLDPKRLIFCLPALYLLLSLSIGRSLKFAIALIILLNINLMAINSYTFNSQAQREPWREVVTEVEKKSSVNSLVVFAFPEAFAPWRYYANPLISTLAISPTSLSDNNIATKLVNSPQIFLFDYLVEMTDPQKQIQGFIQSTHTETGFLQYEGIGKIHIYEKINYYTFRTKPYTCPPRYQSWQMHSKRCLNPIP